MVESARRIVSHQVQDDKALISGRTRKAVVVQLCRLLIKMYSSQSGVLCMYREECLPNPVVYWVWRVVKDWSNWIQLQFNNQDSQYSFLWWKFSSPLERKQFSVGGKERNQGERHVQSKRMILWFFEDIKSSMMSESCWFITWEWVVLTEKSSCQHQVITDKRLDWLSRS